MVASGVSCPEGHFHDALFVGVGGFVGVGFGFVGVDGLVDAVSGGECCGGGFGDEVGVGSDGADAVGVFASLVGEGCDGSEGLSAGHDAQMGVDGASCGGADDGWEDVYDCLLEVACLFVFEEGVCVGDAGECEYVSALCAVIGGECADELVEGCGGGEVAHFGVLPHFFGQCELWVGFGPLVVDVSSGGVGAFGFGVDVSAVVVVCFAQGDVWCGFGVVLVSVDDGYFLALHGEDAGGEVLHFGDEFAQCPVWQCVCGDECGSWVGDDDVGEG